MVYPSGRISWLSLTHSMVVIHQNTLEATIRRVEKCKMSIDASLSSEKGIR
jgi:hypothetical protein